MTRFTDSPYERMMVQIPTRACSHKVENMIK